MISRDNADDGRTTQPRVTKEGISAPFVDLPYTNHLQWHYRGTSYAHILLPLDYDLMVTMERVIKKTRDKDGRADYKWGLPKRTRSDGWEGRSLSLSRIRGTGLIGY